MRPQQSADVSGKSLLQSSHSARGSAASSNHPGRGQRQSEWPAALPQAPEPLQRDLPPGPTEQEILEFLDGLLDGFREAAAKSAESGPSVPKVTLQSQAPYAPYPTGQAESPLFREDVRQMQPRAQAAWQPPGASTMTAPAPQKHQQRLPSNGSSPWDIEGLSSRLPSPAPAPCEAARSSLRDFSTRLPAQQDMHVGTRSMPSLPPDIEQIAGSQSRGFVPVGSAPRALPNPPAAFQPQKLPNPYLDSPEVLKTTTAQSVPEAMRRQALREFLEESFGTVARAFDQMAAAALASRGTRGAKEERMRHAFTAEEFRRTLTSLGYGVHSGNTWWTQLFSSVDVDGNGLVSLEDMYHALVLDDLSGPR